jgi:hypothetical protein
LENINFFIFEKYQLFSFEKKYFFLKTNRLYHFKKKSIFFCIFEKIIFFPIFEKNNFFSEISLFSEKIKNLNILKKIDYVIFF